MDMNGYGFKNMRLVVVLFIANLVTDCTGLQCYDCSYFRLETDNSVVNTALSFLSQISDTACQFKEEDDRLEVNIKNCPTPGSGNVARCVVVKGTVSATLDTPLGDPSFRYYEVERNCIEVPANDDDYEGCHDELASATQQFVKDSIEGDLGVGLSIKNIDFDGEACYYDDLTDSAMMHSYNVIGMLMTVIFAYIMM